MTKEFALNFDGAHANFRGFLILILEALISLATYLLKIVEQWFKTQCLKDLMVCKQFIEEDNFWPDKR